MTAPATDENDTHSERSSRASAQTKLLSPSTRTSTAPPEPRLDRRVGWRARQWRPVAVAVLAAAAAGCGTNDPHQLTAARRAEITAKVKRIAYELSRPRPNARARAGGSQRKAVDPPTEPGVWHANPPEVPGAGGKLRATYRTTLYGGNWISPAGHPGATGHAVIRFYGTTEVCWQFSRLHRFYRKTQMGLFLGNVALDVTKLYVYTIKLGANYRPTGCQTGIATKDLAPIERHPARYFVGIGDIEYFVAAGGQL